MPVVRARQKTGLRFQLDLLTSGRVISTNRFGRFIKVRPGSSLARTARGTTPQAVLQNRQGQKNVAEDWNAN